MKNRVMSICLVVCCLAVFPCVSKFCRAEENYAKEGAYTIVVGKVERVSARMLVIDGQQYPISPFVRVFSLYLNGNEIPMRVIANTGKIDQAKLYLIGGKVEKIIVIKNI